jgi:hypothetical protein
MYHIKKQDNVVEPLVAMELPLGYDAIMRQPIHPQAPAVSNNRVVISLSRKERCAMLEFAADVKVNRPVADVFAWLTNAENQGKFDKSSLKMEVLTPGSWRTGTQFRELRDLGGRKTEVLSEIAELEPNRRFVIRSKTGPGWLGVWVLEPDGVGTQLHWTGQLRMKGLGHLLEPLIGRQMRPAIAQQFARLPSLIEGEVAHQ